MSLVIKVTNLEKKYTKYNRAVRQETIREYLIKKLFPFASRNEKSTEEEFWALRNVSFSVSRGEILGVLGNNGAGKTTLFRVLSRVTEPSSGRVEIYGRLGSLLGAASGFQGDLNAKENIYLNAAIMGMTRSEINRSIDAIIEFAEVGDFLDMPLKHYSSGMQVRLGFSIAAKLLPEALILDETLAVADIGFQEKALEKIKEISRANCSILFVSHNMQTVRSLCTKVLVLQHGQLVFFGDSVEGVQKYVDFNQGKKEVSVTEYS